MKIGLLLSPVDGLSVTRVVLSKDLVVRKKSTESKVNNWRTEVRQYNTKVVMRTVNKVAEAESVTFFYRE